MKIRIPFVVMLVVTVLCVVGCGRSPETIATQTAAAASATALASPPKPGHWIGENPSASFEITSDGKIHNLTLRVGSSLSNPCSIVLKEDSIIGTDGAFLIGEKDSDGTLKMNSISGKFDGPTKLKGAFSQAFKCGDRIYVHSSGSGSADPSWNAEWKEP